MLIRVRAWTRSVLPILLLGALLGAAVATQAQASGGTRSCAVRARSGSWAIAEYSYSSFVISDVKIVREGITPAERDRGMRAFAKPVGRRSSSRRLALKVWLTGGKGVGAKRLCFPHSR